MGTSLNSEETIRKYLLGRVSDEIMLEGIEELLFTDEEFCSQVALAEDGLINDYVFGKLDDADAQSFRETLATNPERQFKLELTQALREKALARNLKTAEDKPSFFASLILFFRQPRYVGALAVLLIAVVGLAVYLNTRPKPDELAELRSMYQQARPTETRITEFGYAPLTQLRGAPEPGAQRGLRRIENSLIEATEKTPNAKTHHALGIFHLTQQEYADAIKEFDSALKYEEKNARIHNDLGVAQFELSKTIAREKNLEGLAQSLEEFTKATELDGNLLEALFNKSLALQELGMAREAKESWTLYLQRDPSSRWAEEARRNLERIQSAQTLFKTDEQLLSDFLTAYRSRDHARAQRIHNETKGLLREPALPLQLSKRYLLATERVNEAESDESLDALAYIGRFEQTQTGDAFCFELANFYTNAGADKTRGLLRAKDVFASAHRSIDAGDYRKAITDFESSRDLFARFGDECEAAIAENWAAQLLTDVGRVSESRRRLTAIIARAESRKFNILLPPAYYWIGMADYSQNRLSESARNLKTALRLAEAGNNTFEIQHAEDALVVNYFKIGELEPAMFYASKLLSQKPLHYQNEKQFWRSKGTLADLSLNLKFFSTSLSLSKEALSVARDSWPGSSRLNDSLRHTAYSALAKGDSAAALNYATDSLQIAENRVESAGNMRIKAEIYRLLAEIKSKTEDCSDALTDYDKALELYGRLPELTVSSYQLHKGKLFCFRQLNQQEKFAGELKIVLDLSEKYRRTIREDSSRRAFFANENVVYDAAIENAISERDSRGAFAFAEASKARSLLEFVQSRKSIAEVENDFASFARPISSTDIQSRLPEQIQFVQYAVLPDKLAIWIVSKTRFEFFEKQITAAQLESKIGAYQASIRAKASPLDLRESARELYELLIPLDLATEVPLCLIPDKFLHQIAFATLVSHAGKYLLEERALFYSPSASVLVLATENARRKEQVRNESLLSIGNPDFEREENQNLPDLRAAEAEADAIAGDYERSTELVRDQATKDEFLRNFANVEVVHFAGHFVANRQSPGNSKLLFAGGELRSSELSAYKLPRAKLIVMSACETGFERYDKSEGAIGVARTFLALGAPIVVASQWKVDSEPTKDLMIAFHRNRKQKHMPSAESLRQAQLELLSMDETKAPFYWAAFSLFGGYANY